MSSIVLINEDGTVYKKLAITSLPSDYKVPEGKIVSFRVSFEFQCLIDDPFHKFTRKEPLQANFYLGDAWGNIAVTKVTEKSFRHSNHRILTVTVQGTNGSDVNNLRDHMMDLVLKNGTWDVHNDLNPEPESEKIGFWERIFPSTKTA